MLRYCDLSTQFPNGGTVKRPKSRQYKVLGLAVALILFNANTQKHTPLGKIQGIGCHWNAGGWNHPWDDYHINVVWDHIKGAPFAIAALRPTQKGQHMLGRNTGLFGLAFCAANWDKVQPAQIEMFAKIAAEVCHKHDLKPDGKRSIPDGVYSSKVGTVVMTGNGYNQIDVIADHAQFAVLDGYFPHRVDIGSQDPRPQVNLMKKVREKAIWYYKQIKLDSKGKGIYEFDAII